MATLSSSAPPSENSFLVQTRPHLLLRWMLGLAVCVFLFLGYCAWEAQLPNQTVTFTRQAYSTQPAAALGYELQTVSEWKNWFHNLQSAQIVDSENHVLPRDQQIARSGAIVEMHMKPVRFSSRKTELVGKITRFEPGQLLEIKILDDSSGKLLRLFDHLLWRVELQPDGSSRVRILGTEIAHTAHWRSRLFARLGKRIMMNQIFYPNLVLLADPAQKPKPDLWGNPQ